MSEKVILAFDCGGTKCVAGVVTEKGQILKQIRQKIDITAGSEALLTQMIAMGSELATAFPSIEAIGVSSAGPLDSERGVLVDPTNFKTNEDFYFEVPIVERLKKQFKLPCFLENDAACAILAEKKYGKAEKFRNAMIITLGTGVGIGTVCNNELVKGGRNLHPEASHITINYRDLSAPCGCGNYGCIEAYLSAKNFTQRVAKKLNIKNLSGEALLERARNGDSAILQEFSEYSELFAAALHSLCVVYYPEAVLITGGFSEAASFFLENTKSHLKNFLKRRLKSFPLFPILEVSALGNDACLLGGAVLAIDSKNVSASHRK